MGCLGRKWPGPGPGSRPGPCKGPVDCICMYTSICTRIYIYGRLYLVSLSKPVCGTHHGNFSTIWRENLPLRLSLENMALCPNRTPTFVNGSAGHERGRWTHFQNTYANPLFVGLRDRAWSNSIPGGCQVAKKRDLLREMYVFVKQTNSMSFITCLAPSSKGGCRTKRRQMHRTRFCSGVGRSRYWYQAGSDANLMPETCRCRTQGY